MSPAIAACKVPDPETAGVLLNALRAASGTLNDALFDIQAYESAEQCKLIVRAIATVMGMDMHDLLICLLKQHPDLDEYGILSSSPDPKAPERSR